MCLRWTREVATQKLRLRQVVVTVFIAYFNSTTNTSARYPWPFMLPTVQGPELPFSQPSVFIQSEVKMLKRPVCEIWPMAHLALNRWLRPEVNVWCSRRTPDPSKGKISPSSYQAAGKGKIGAPASVIEAEIE